MTPYTEADLRAEARLHLDEDSDSLAILADMADREPWHSLTPEDFNDAHSRIVDLATTAADVSGWAVGLGADGLIPSDAHQITLDGNGTPIMRVHFAFDAEMPEEIQTAIVRSIGATLSVNLPGSGGTYV